MVGHCSAMVVVSLEANAPVGYSYRYANNEAFMPIVPMVRLIVLNDEAQVLLVKDGLSERWQIPELPIQTGVPAATVLEQCAKTKAGIELLEVECIGYLSKAEPLPENACDHHALIFVSTHWVPDAQFNNAEPVKFYSTNSLPSISTATQSTLAIFNSWLAERAMQFQ